MRKKKIKIIEEIVVRKITMEYHKNDKNAMLEKLHKEYGNYRTISMGIIPTHSDLYDANRKGMCRITFEVEVV